MEIIKIIFIILLIFGCSNKTENGKKGVNEIGLKEGKEFLTPTFRLPASKEERCDGSKGYWHSNKTKSGTIEGGFVADSAYVGESVFLGKTVSVCGNATVDGETKITGDVIIDENATISGRVKIQGKVIIDGNVTISDDVIINGNPIHITGNSIIRDQAKIIGKANISGDAIIKERAVIKENATIKGNALIEGDVVIEKNLSIDSDKYFLPAISPSAITTTIRKKLQEKSILEAQMEATRKREEAIAKEEKLEKDKLAELENEKMEIAEKEKQKLEDEKKLWEKVFIYFEKFYSAGDFEGLFRNLEWAINYSNNDGPIFYYLYDTKDHYLIEESKYFSKKGCDQFEKCNPIKIEISSPEECKVSITFQSFDRGAYSFWLKGTIDFSKDVREIKIVEKMGWSKNPNDDKFKSYGIFFKNPISFDHSFLRSQLTKSVRIDSTMNLKEFHFPIFQLDALKSKTIIVGFTYLKKLCEKK
jgi:carbonic anhydrase/acetyltransferase-like protein (isoleucine patch superfamily)